MRRCLSFWSLFFQIRLSRDSSVGFQITKSEQLFCRPSLVKHLFFIARGTRTRECLTISCPPRTVHERKTHRKLPYAEQLYIITTLIKYWEHESRLDDTVAALRGLHAWLTLLMSPQAGAIVEEVFLLFYFFSNPHMS
jgi:hypothetical protein